MSDVCNVCTCCTYVFTYTPPHSPTLQHQPHPPHCHFPIISHPPFSHTHILHIQTHSFKAGINKVFDDESEFNHESHITSTHTQHQHQVRRICGINSFEKGSTGTLPTPNKVSSLEAHRTNHRSTNHSRTFTRFVSSFSQDSTYTLYVRTCVCV